jgi:hypothetical protein
MRLESQYRLRRRRGFLVLVGVAFALAAAAAPSVHPVDGGGAVHPAVETTSDAGAATEGFQVASPSPGPGEPTSPLPAGHLDCLICAVLNLAAPAGFPPVSQGTAVPVPTLPLFTAAASPEVGPLGAALPRGPPSA